MYRQFLWASNNFFCLNATLTVHNRQSLQHALETIANFNFSQYVNDARALMSEKYSTVVLHCCSIVFSVTRLPHMAFGTIPRHLTQKRCSRKKLKNNDCVFLALSNFFRVESAVMRKRTNTAAAAAAPDLSCCVRVNEKYSLKYSNFPSKRPNLRVASLIKELFLNEIKLLAPLTKYYGKQGVTSNGLFVLENILQISLNIFKKKIERTKVIKRNNLCDGKLKCVNRKVRDGSRGETRKCINLEVKFESKQQGHMTAITCPTLFSNKYTCYACNKMYSTKQWLSHHKCEFKNKLQIPKYFCDKVVSFRLSPEKCIQSIFPEHPLNVSDNYVFVTLSKSENTEKSLFVCHITLVERNTTALNNVKTFSNLNIFSLAKTCLEYISEATRLWRIRNFFQNASLIIEASNSKNELLKPVTDMISLFASHTCVFLNCSVTENIHMRQFYRALLSAFLTKNPSISKCKIKYTQGNLSQLVFSTDCSAVNVLNAENFFGKLNKEISSISPESHLNSCIIFHSLASLVKSHFNMNILTGLYTSATVIANAFFEAKLAMTNLCIRSPSQSLRNALLNECRYGYLHHVPCVVDKNNKDMLHSFIQIDFAKYYKSILQNFFPHLSSPIEFVRHGTIFEPVQKKIPIHARANIFIRTITDLVIGYVCSHLTGKEFLITKHHAIDAVFHLPLPSSERDLRYEKVFFQYDGCYFHACQSDCHTQYANATHTQSCNVCGDYKKPNNTQYFFSPTLWKRPQDSIIHPGKKIPYDQVSKLSNDTHSKLKSICHPSRYIVLRECELLTYFHKPISAILNFLNLPMKTNAPQLMNHTLSSLYYNCAAQLFPTLFSSSKKTMGWLLTHLRKNSLNGFLRVSGSLGEKSTNLLGSFKAFSSIKDGKMFNSKKRGFYFI